MTIGLSTNHGIVLEDVTTDKSSENAVNLGISFSFILTHVKGTE